MSYTPPLHKKLFHTTRRFLAKEWLKRHHVLQIGITGSQGKTNTTSIITTMLATVGKTLVTDTNLDTTYNVPITALKVRPDVQFLVWELGIDHPGEMAAHLQIAKPQIGIVTGISPVHTDEEHMGSLHNLIAEKRKLVEALPTNGYAILNWDDENVRGMAEHTKARVLWYGTDPKNCDVWVDLQADSTVLTLNGLTCELHDKEASFTVKTPLVGLHHAYNLMAAYLLFKVVIACHPEVLRRIPHVCATAYTGEISPPFAGSRQRRELHSHNTPVQDDTQKSSQISIAHTKDRFAQIARSFLPLPGRMSVEPGPMGSTVVNDSLRANPTSTRFGLQTVSQIQHAGRKIAVLAEMGELEKPEEEHAKLGEFIATLRFDTVIVIGPLHKETAKAAQAHGFTNTHWVSDVFGAAEKLKQELRAGDIIYLKGSLLRHVERVLLILNGRKVSCKRILCHFYRNCAGCEFLSTTPSGT